MSAPGHKVAILHGRADAGTSSSDVVKIQGNRNRLPWISMQIQQFSPDVVIDMILSFNLLLNNLLQSVILRHTDVFRERLNRLQPILRLELEYLARQ